jgi:hypothetical protein
MLISGSLPETIHQMITNPDTQGGWLERLAKLGADGLVEDLNRMVERGSVEGLGCKRSEPFWSKVGLRL